MGDLLPEMAVGVARLLSESPAGADTQESSADMGRRMLIRLETSSNRASLKKLPEMIFLMLQNHECYQSHATWTVFVAAYCIKDTARAR